jgi:hypothetical protein
VRVLARPSASERVTPRLASASSVGDSGISAGESEVLPDCDEPSGGAPVQSGEEPSHGDEPSCSAKLSSRDEPTCSEGLPRGDEPSHCDKLSSGDELSRGDTPVSGNGPSRSVAPSSGLELSHGNERSKQSLGNELLRADEPPRAGVPSSSDDWNRSAPSKSARLRTRGEQQPLRGRTSSDLSMCPPCCELQVPRVL